MNERPAPKPTEPSSPEPKAPPAPATVRLRTKPHALYAPARGARYAADAEGFIDAAAEHADALVRAGCERT